MSKLPMTNPAKLKARYREIGAWLLVVSVLLASAAGILTYNKEIFRGMDWAFYQLGNLTSSEPVRVVRDYYRALNDREKEKARKMVVAREQWVFDQRYKAMEEWKLQYNSVRVAVFEQVSDKEVIVSVVTVQVGENQGYKLDEEITLYVKMKNISGQWMISYEEVAAEAAL